MQIFVKQQKKKSIKVISKITWYENSGCYLRVQTAFLNSVIIHRFVNTDCFPLQISTEAAFKKHFH